MINWPLRSGSGCTPCTWSPHRGNQISLYMAIRSAFAAEESDQPLQQRNCRYFPTHLVNVEGVWWRGGGSTGHTQDHVQWRFFRDAVAEAGLIHVGVELDE